MSSRDAALIGAALAFTAGFADASTFVGADGVFCAHVTGNFVVLASDFALRANAEEWLKLATFPIFVGTVLATAGLTRSAAGALPAPMVRRILAVKAGLLGAAALLGLIRAAQAPGLARTTIVGLLVIAMGIQNALHRLHPSLGVTTTVMTGNVTQWLTGWVVARGPGEAGRRRALGTVLASFAIGCAGGAFGVVSIGFGVLVVPAVVVLVARSRVA
jgi:uncharacterized membrane protein YoaK (UPF0700 family)